MQELQNWLVQAQAGDADAYAEIMRRFQDMAVGYAYSVVGDFHLAEDIAQEAFLEAYLHLPRVYNAFAFPNWLRKIVFKHCDRFRRKKRITTIDLEAVDWEAADVDNALASADPIPPEVLSIQETSGVLSAAIKQLPSHQRTAILLYYISEYSQKEVAAFLDVSITTVNNWLHAARKQLRKRMTISMVQESLQGKRPSKDTAFVDGVLALLAPNQEQHSEALYTLVDADDRLDAHRNGRIAYSHYDWQTSRVGFRQDDMIVHIGVYDVTMRIGSARVRVAGVNADKMNPDYRDITEADMKQAYIAMKQQALEDTLKAMQANGYDLSLGCMVDPTVFGAAGYIRAFPETHFYLRTEDMPTGDLSVGPLPASIEAFSTEDFDGLVDRFAELYNQENALVTGTAVRPTYRYSKVPGGYHGTLWRDADGAIDGYVLFYRPSETDAVLSVEESAGTFEDRLHVLEHLARQWGCNEVEFFRQPYNSPLGQYLRRLDVRLHRGYRKTQKHMIRIINLASLMEKLTDEFSQRLEQSHLKEWRGDLTIFDEQEQVTLRIEHAQCTVQTIPQPSQHSIHGELALAQLVIGTDEPMHIVEQHQLMLTGDAAILIPVLFPAQHPQMANHGL